MTGSDDELPGAGRPLRELSIVFTELEDAFENSSYEMTFLLDTETGQVILLSDELRDELDSVWAEEALTGGVEPSVLEAILEQRELEDWERSAVRAAILFEAGVGDRYVEIPRQDSREGFMDMEEFIETVGEARLRDRLWGALRQRRPFRRFKDTLLHDEAETERWYVFQRERLRERMQRWLRVEGISGKFVDFKGNPWPQA
jgi:hypothetical protein